jgi:hypothetical protein
MANILHSDSGVLMRRELKGVCQKDLCPSNQIPEKDKPERQALTCAVEFRESQLYWTCRDFKIRNKLRVLKVSILGALLLFLILLNFCVPHFVIIVELIICTFYYCLFYCYFNYQLEWVQLNVATVLADVRPLEHINVPLLRGNNDSVVFMRRCGYKFFDIFIYLLPYRHHKRVVSPYYFNELVRHFFGRCVVDNNVLYDYVRRLAAVNTDIRVLTIVVDTVQFYVDWNRYQCEIKERFLA